METGVEGREEERSTVAKTPTHWQVLKRPQLLRSTRHTLFTVEEYKYFLFTPGAGSDCRRQHRPHD